MYIPHFEITNKILRQIGIIEACREVIENAPLIPAYEKKFKDDLVVRTVHHATHLEGNDLTFDEAKRVIEGKVVTANERDIQEVINYRNVLRYLSELENQVEESKQFIFKENHLTRIHYLVVEKIIPKSQAGHFRQEEVVLKNSSTGEVVFRPPPALEVPYFLAEFFDWLNQAENQEIHPVICSGVSLYLLYSIHPFTEGNGRTARGFASLVLFTKGYNVRKLFSLEEFFDSHSEDYYQALAKTDQTHSQIFQRDLTSWLEFFSLALGSELSRLKEVVKDLSVDGKLKELLGGKQITLSERQVRLMDYLAEYGQIKMIDAKGIVPMVSEDTLLRDLQDLIKKGILRKKGTTKSAIYILRIKRGKEE